MSGAADPGPGFGQAAAAGEETPALEGSSSASGAGVPWAAQYGALLSQIGDVLMELASAELDPDATESLSGFVVGIEVGRASAMELNRPLAASMLDTLAEMGRLILGNVLEVR